MRLVSLGQNLEVFLCKHNSPTEATGVPVLRVTHPISLRVGRKLNTQAKFCAFNGVKLYDMMYK